MRLRAVFSVVFLLFSLKEAFCTHLRAADIVVEQQCNSLTYQITIRVFMNTNSSTPFGGFTLDDGHISFGDGTVHIIPPTSFVARPDLGEDIGVATFTISHTYASAGTYQINYFERDRSRGVVNVPNSHDVAYSTYTIINAQKNVCNKFPVLQVAPVDRACKGITFFHTAGATDADGDSLSYELTVPQQAVGVGVVGFLFPDNRAFYTNFSTGNENGTGPPSFSIDAVTGLITWNAPGKSGEYNIAFHIIEWKRGSDGSFTKISTTTRDMQIVVEDCANGRPTLTTPQDICVEAGTVITAKILGHDPDSNPVRIEVFSSIFDGEAESIPATYAPLMTDFVPSNPPAEINFEWKTNCIHVRDQAYQVVFKITDNPPSGPKIVTFKTWSIRVIGPAPKWISTEADLVNRTALLSWESYACTNAEKIQLWRKVGSTPFTPAQCTAGLSVHKGYALVAEFDPSVTSYNDTNNGKRLVVGAQYCYRLVAVFASPGNGRSYVSAESCIDPILADAPVITNVTVSKTASPNGNITVKWLKPFDISSDQYPEPYEYEVYRSDGYTQTDVPVNVSGRILSASFVDESVNTSDNVYNYQVVLYSKPKDLPGYVPVDTSSVASSVGLELLPGEKKFTLNWNADVPWSNVAQQRPYHRIYRGVFGDRDNELVLIDSVEVTEFGFTYEDIGQFNGEPIEEDVFYCYAVETIGTYGNGKIPLVFNRSRMACSYPVNNLPVCTPLLTVEKTDCATFATLHNCGESAFENMIQWTMPETRGCRNDIVGFKLYYSDNQASSLDLLKDVGYSFAYTDPVESMARCYRITAIDANGIESAMSEELCNENCPYFSLPNVFTPNNDGCNDLFSAYNPPGQGSSLNCDDSGMMQCPRFVSSVSMKIVNRWGRTVFEFYSDDPQLITIDWDGRDKNGDKLDPGIYYYEADIRFITTDPASSRKKLKGPIQLVR
jgi:hypothetical protein